MIDSPALRRVRRSAPGDVARPVARPPMPLTGHMVTAPAAVKVLGRGLLTSP